VHLRLLGQPHAPLGIARNAVRRLQVGVARGQSGGRDAAAMRGSRDLITEHLVQATIGVGLAPGGHTMAVHAQQGRQRLALPGVSTPDPIQGLQSWPPLGVLGLFHVVRQRCSVFGDGRHLLSHTPVLS
jgi:hypothetical protein